MVKPPSTYRKENDMKPVTQNRCADIGLFLIRAVLAVVFIYHGSQKLFGWFGGHGIGGTAGWMESMGIPYPMLSAVLAGGTEFFGGIVKGESSCPAPSRSHN